MFRPDSRRFQPLDSWSVRAPRHRDTGSLAQLNAILHEFSLSVCNPVNSPSHRAGAALDLVIASEGLLAAPPEVHNGFDCNCPNRSWCCPALNSDHFLISVPLVIPPQNPASNSSEDHVSRPFVSDWANHLQHRADALTVWHRQVRDHLCHLPEPAHARSIVDNLYSELQGIIWGGCERRRRCSPHQVQPAWWNDACYNAMVHRNAAWRERCRNPCHQTQSCLHRGTARIPQNGQEIPHLVLGNVTR